jgi:hypothetical protein
MVILYEILRVMNDLVGTLIAGKLYGAGAVIADNRRSLGA